MAEPFEYVLGNVAEQSERKPRTPWHLTKPGKATIFVMSVLLHSGIIAILATECWDHLKKGTTAILWIVFAVVSLVVQAALICLLLHAKKELRESELVRQSLASARHRLDAQCHSVLHCIRDRLVELSSRIGQSTTDKELSSLRGELAGSVAHVVRDYFRILLPEDHVGCALRLLRVKKRKEEFVTYGRSGLDENRNANDSILPADEGIPALFRVNFSEQGVIIYRDLTESARRNAYQMTKNDARFPDDIKTFMVAPINGEEDGQKKMIGLLYVTSRSDVFQKAHTEPLRAFADALGVLFSFFRDKVVLKSGVPPSSAPPETGGLHGAERSQP